MGKSKETVFETTLNGKECVLNVVTSREAGWYIISVVDKNEILQKSRMVTNILLGIYMMTFMLIFFIVFHISKRFTRPILEISYAINRMDRL